MCVRVHVCVFTEPCPAAGLTDDLLQRLRENTPKSLLADLKDSVKNDRSLNIKDKYGATAVSAGACGPCPPITHRHTLTYKHT